jgi:hypothetical protein
MRVLAMSAVGCLLSCDGPFVGLATRGTDGSSPPGEEPNTADENTEQNGMQNDEQACRFSSDCTDEPRSLCSPTRHVCVPCLVDTDCVQPATCDADGECDPSDSLQSS